MSNNAKQTIVQCCENKKNEQKLLGFTLRVFCFTNNKTATTMLSSHSRKSFVNTKNVCLQVFAKRGYYELAEKPQDAEKPFPWRSVRLKQDEKTPHPLHVAVYNPKGTSLRPPMPIIMLPGLTSNYKVFSAICRKMNYPYGVLAMDLRGRGMSQVRSDEKQPDQYPSSLLEYALDVTRVLKFFHLYKAFIVGYDIGGMQICT